MPERAIETADTKTAEATLDAWIARATHGLCAQATERVRREITSHHAEAVENSCASGLSAEAASTRALTGLGDAAKANKALRKTYLTTWQQQLLAGLAQPVRPLNLANDETQAPMALAILVALFTFAQVCHDFGDTSLLRHCGYLPIFAFFVPVYIINPLFLLIRWQEDGTLPDRPAEVYSLYPLVLSIFLLWLYAIWRIQYQSLHMPFLGDPLLFPLLFVFSRRIHRGTGAYCFAPSQSRTSARTVTTAAYTVFLVLASAACACFPYSWALIKDMGASFMGMPPEFVFHVDSQPADLLLALDGIASAVILLFVATRWTIGLYLLRKDVNGDGMTEPGPTPSPETPLGE